MTPRRWWASFGTGSPQVTLLVMVMVTMRRGGQVGSSDQRLADAAQALAAAFDKLSGETAALRGTIGPRAEDSLISEIAVALFHALDAVVVVGEDGLIALINTEAELLTGYSRSALRGQPVEVLLPERLREAHAAVNRPLFTSEPRLRAMGAALDLRLLRRSGEEVAVDIRLAPFVTSLGMFVGASIRRKS